MFHASYRGEVAETSVPKRILVFPLLVGKAPSQQKSQILWFGNETLPAMESAVRETTASDNQGGEIPMLVSPFNSWHNVQDDRGGGDQCGVSCLDTNGFVC